MITKGVRALEEQNEKKKSLKTAAVVGIAALAVLSILLAVFINSVEKNRHETITLPDASTEPSTAPQQPDTALEEDVFVQISAENVQSVLSELARPSDYHQVLTLTTYSGEAAREQQAELWVSGAHMLIRLSDEYAVQSYLTDGEMLYLWYGDADDVTALPLNADTGRDDLTGVPTYESLLALPQEQIRDAQFLSFSEQNDLQCVFVECAQNDVQTLYWIALDSGLLYRYSALSDGQPFYTVQQTQLELLTADDEVFDSIFALPDGSQPFSPEASSADTQPEQ